MDMVEVDPKLFVTCRLCLEDLGQYQIVPSVQQQIKYCFDIDVEPFDGLPQLICMKCKEILTNFLNIKTTLKEKQTNLRNKLYKKEINKSNDDTLLQETCVQPQQDAVSSSQQTSEYTDIKRPKSKIRVIESSESDNSCSVTKTKKKKIVKSQIIWDCKGFTKCYTCIICKSKWTTARSFYNHVRQHKKIKTTYPSIFKKNCSVILKKLDNKPNFTGLNKLVVHNSNKIIQNCNSLYYIKYSKQTNDDDQDSDSEIPYKEHMDLESTDTDQEITAKCKRKKRRMLSRSSNDTVVIESNCKKAASDEEATKPTQECLNVENTQTDNQCINIDDSSDSDTDRCHTESRLKLKAPMEAKLGDYKIIQGIITMCVSTYHRKNELMDKTDKQTSIESQLKHKILSFGKKIISNRQGMNWTGLLRFLEHKNLPIIWVTKALSNSNTRESNYIRVLAKLRGKEITTDDIGWEPVKSEPQIVQTDMSLNANWPTIPLSQNFNNLQPPQDTSIYFLCAPPDPKSKLLNANPVANPKQLPRKLTQASESKLNKTTTESCIPFIIENSDSLPMPIITSTTSLAEPAAVELQTNENKPAAVNSNKETSLPRIKVKPVSELMSERTLISLRNEQLASVSTSNMLVNQNEIINEAKSNNIENGNSLVLNQITSTSNIVVNPNVWTSPGVSNVFMQPIQLVPLSCLNVAPTSTFQAISSSVTPTSISSMTISQATDTSTVIPMTVTATKSKNVNGTAEYVLLNTVELPNTKTNSPFQYLKQLLQLYNLVLFDPQETLPREFICLIKFKVQFKQEPIDEPVLLCLSLFCSKNKFCFTVRDRNQKNININKISPNWQWEILNVFRGDLVEKLLQNAQKHSQETHDFTNNFLCLLKSIDFTKLS